MTLDPICSLCGNPQDSDLEWRCQSCQGPFTISYHEPFDTRKMRSSERSMWRYEQSLMIPKNTEPLTLGEGGTPLIKLGASHTYVKMEFVSPTGSFKDRGSTTMLTVLRKVSKKTGRKKLVNDSSGNAGASVAAYAASAGLKCEIYVPEKASESKLRQIAAYGATVIKVPGTRENQLALSQSEGERNIYASHIWNPYFPVGIRTLAYEISEQMNWTAPDYVFLPASAGSLLLGVHSGFRHLVDSNVLSSMPKIVAVQSDEMAPLYHAFHNLPYTPPKTMDFLTDALISTNPVRIKEMLAALRETKGGCEVVSRQEILSSQRELGTSGIYVEPSSAVVYAAWKRYSQRNWLTKDDVVTLILTGNGLKTSSRL